MMKQTMHIIVRNFRMAGCFLLFFGMLFTRSIPVEAQIATASSDITVAEGTNTSEQLPVIPIIEITPDQAEKQDDYSEKDNSTRKILLYIASAVLLISSVAFFIILGIWLSERKNRNQVSQEEPRSITPELNKTEMLFHPIRQSTGTQMLWGDGLKAEAPSRVILIDLKHPGVSYRAEIVDTISLGRINSNDIVIADDSTVSGHHMEFVKKGILYYIRDTGSSNGTYLKGTRIDDESLVFSGDVLEIGHGQYRVIFEDAE